MKYALTIDIDLPREKVIELFDNPENMKHWQKGFISMTHMSGTPGEVGAKSRLQYKMGKREIEMVETIVNNNFPHEFTATYVTPTVWNENKNTFEKQGAEKTRWKQETEFKFSGFMKLMAFFMPGAFKKQSYTFMEDFKTFAEKQI